MQLPFSQTARSALLVVDMQNFFFQKDERRRLLMPALEKINRLIDFFDAQDLPVVHVVSGYMADGSDWDLKMKAAGAPELIEGTPEAEILPEIIFREAHLVVRKTSGTVLFSRPPGRAAARPADRAGGGGGRGIPIIV